MERASVCAPRPPRPQGSAAGPGSRPARGASERCSILAEGAAKVAAGRGDAEGAAARVEVKERLLLDGIDRLGKGQAVDQGVEAAVPVLANQAGALVPGAMRQRWLHSAQRTRPSCSFSYSIASFTGITSWSRRVRVLAGAATSPRRGKRASSPARDAWAPPPATSRWALPGRPARSLPGPRAGRPPAVDCAPQ
jgi:hypothetical protein